MALHESIVTNMEALEDSLVRIPYRKFLSTPACLKLDLDVVLKQLQEKEILTEMEVRIIQNEPTRESQLQCLFIICLPQKGLNGFNTLEEILRGHDFAAEELCYCVPDELLPYFDPPSHTRPTRSRSSRKVIPLLSRSPKSWIRALLVDHELGMEATEAEEDELEELETSDPMENEPPRSSSADNEKSMVLTHQICPSDVSTGDLIGRGGFAEVCIGMYRNERVAVKKFSEFDEEKVAVFLSEVDIMSSLCHPNVVGFIKFVYEPEIQYLWLVMEYVAGSMRRFCTPRSGQTEVLHRLSFEEKLLVAAECWNGLAYLHGKKLCHKDLSPDNILVAVSEALKVLQVKISDFGLAEFKKRMATMRTGGAGTFMYYPPEVARGKARRHPSKSDVFSMAASHCELFSEQYMWHVEGRPREPIDVMNRLRSLRKGQYSDCWPAIPEHVRSLLANAITSDYGRRKTALEMQQLTLDLIESTGGSRTTCA